jgi:hypothetical protein
MQRFFAISHHVTLGGYILSLIGLLVYSFALMDPNLTLINHPLWTSFRDTMVQFGYLNRPDSWGTYLVLVSLLFIFHLLFLRQHSHISPTKLALITGGILLFSYPMLSHDFFNYIFDAKILTFYGENPYTHMPGEFPRDEWLRFMQWTHRTYPYGPTFLPLTLLVSFVSFGKFILNYIFFKAVFIAAYIGSVWALEKMNKHWALFFATSPLVIIEGVVNAHNDLLAVFFAIIGIYMLSQSEEKWGGWKARLVLLLSGGIKYFTLPALIVQKPKGHGREDIYTVLSAVGVLGLVLYVSFSGALQPWYYLNIFVFLPYFYSIIKKFHITFFGLVVSYYPIIRFGVWEPTPGVNTKNLIIYGAFALNLLWIWGHMRYQRHAQKTERLP